jgi:hypothetical protein
MNSRLRADQLAKRAFLWEFDFSIAKIIVYRMNISAKKEKRNVHHR